MKSKFVAFACAVILQLWLEACLGSTARYVLPGSHRRVCAAVDRQGDGNFQGIRHRCQLVYMEGGRLSIQSLLSNSTQFMTGDAVSALSAIAGGADIVLLASAKNVLPYVFAVSKDVRRPQELKGKIIATSQIGGRAGEIARMVIRNIGLDPDKDVTYLAVGGTMSRLAALSTGKVHAAPISQIVVPVAEERGLKIMQLEPIPLIIDALWTSRKFAEENPQVVQNVLRATFGRLPFW